MSDPWSRDSLCLPSGCYLKQHRQSPHSEWRLGVPKSSLSISNVGENFRELSTLPPFHPESCEKQPLRVSASLTYSTVNLWQTHTTKLLLPCVIHHSACLKREANKMPRWKCICPWERWALNVCWSWGSRRTYKAFSRNKRAAPLVRRRDRHAHVSWHLHSIPASSVVLFSPFRETYSLNYT